MLFGLLLLICLIPTAHLSDIKDKKGLNIAICNAHISKNSSTQQASILENHRKYASKHNYAYFSQTTSMKDAHGSAIEYYWVKTHLLLKLLSEPYKFDWILWVDSDAIFVNMSISIQHLLSDESNGIVTESLNNKGINTTKGMVGSLQGNRRKSKINAKKTITSLVFSGDTNAINAGILLFHRTKFSLYLLREVIKIGDDLRKYGQIGMGTDNAAFAILFGGCNTSGSIYEDYKKCYDKVDIGFKNGRQIKEVVRQISGSLMLIL
jgi:hypothetical protein